MWAGGGVIGGWAQDSTRIAACPERLGLGQGQGQDSNLRRASSSVCADVSPVPKPSPTRDPGPNEKPISKRHAYTARPYPSGMPILHAHTQAACLYCTPISKRHAHTARPYPSGMPTLMLGSFSSRFDYIKAAKPKPSCNCTSHQRCHSHLIRHLTVPFCPHVPAVLPRWISIGGSRSFCRSIVWFVDAGHPAGP